MSEKYIERLQRERGELLTYARSVDEWRAALDRANNTIYKHDAFKVVDEKRAAMDAAHKIIEPLLAE